MNFQMFIGFLILMILVYYATKPTNKNEGFETRCPNLLIQKNSRFYLHNTNRATVPGINPVEFDNLEDYTEFLDWQKSQGLKCPVLFLQQTYDTQGEPVYKVRPDVTDQGGVLVDATRNDPPYNQQSMPAFDQSSFYVGQKTPLDDMKQPLVF